MLRIAAGYESVAARIGTMPFRDRVENTAKPASQPIPVAMRNFTTGERRGKVKS